MVQKIDDVSSRSCSGIRGWRWRQLTTLLLVWLATSAATRDCCCGTCPVLALPLPGVGNCLQFDEVEPGLVTLTICPNDRIPPDATITIENFRTEQIAGGPVGADGSFQSLPFFAQEGDIVQVSFRTPDDEGGVYCVRVGRFGETLLDSDKVRCEG